MPQVGFLSEFNQLASIQSSLQAHIVSVSLHCCLHTPFPHPLHPSTASTCAASSQPSSSRFTSSGIWCYMDWDTSCLNQDSKICKYLVAQSGPASHMMLAATSREISLYTLKPRALATLSTTCDNFHHVHASGMARDHSSSPRVAIRFQFEIYIGLLNKSRTPN